MPMKRVIEAAGNNLVQRSLDYKRDTQLFFYDSNTHTIRSKIFKDKSIEI
jgi:hypothetical protein